MSIRFPAVIASLVLAVSLAGCSGSSSSQNTGAVILPAGNTIAVATNTPEYTVTVSSPSGGVPTNTVVTASTMSNPNAVQASNQGFGSFDGVAYQITFSPSKIAVVSGADAVHADAMLIAPVTITLTFTSPTPVSAAEQASAHIYSYSSQTESWTTLANNVTSAIVQRGSIYLGSVSATLPPSQLSDVNEYAVFYPLPPSGPAQPFVRN